MERRHPFRMTLETLLGHLYPPSCVPILAEAPRWAIPQRLAIPPQWCFSSCAAPPSPAHFYANRFHPLGIQPSDRLRWDQRTFRDRTRGAINMAKAIWGGKVIAESNNTVVVEGNEYFPPDAVTENVLKSSAHTSICPWKGTAHYYHVEVDGMNIENAAWNKPEPKIG